MSGERNHELIPGGSENLLGELAIPALQRRSVADPATRTQDLLALARAINDHCSPRESR
jgi:hypothetical protein